MGKSTDRSDLPFVDTAVRLVRRIGVWLCIGLFAALSGIVAFGHFASEMGEGETAGLDTAVRESVHSFATPLLTEVMIVFSFLGSALFLTMLGVSIFGFLLYVGWKREAVIFLIANAGELLLNLGLKAFYQRPRPEPFFEYALPNSYSFPSGHALGSFCFYAILAWLIVSYARNAGQKVATVAAAVVLIAAIGVSRIYLGVHYPSDVIAGYMAAAVWTLTVILVDRYQLGRQENSHA